MTEPTKTLLLDPAGLADHPLLAHIPVWAKDSEEFKSLRESLRTDGQLYEILIDSGHRVVDGRNRRNALAAIGAQATCRIVPDAEVSTIIFRALMQRRHFGKGALAFLAVPLVQPLIAAAQARRLACLRRGDSPVTAPCGDGSMECIARDVGVSKDTFDRARRLYELLSKAPENVRADVSARVLSGELELGYACTTVVNYEQAPARTAALDKRQQHDRLFTRALPKLEGHWTQSTPEQREAIREKFRSSVATWPRDLLEEAQTAIRAALKLQSQPE